MAERVDLALEQLQLMADYKGERVGVLETRKHLALYFKSLPRTSELRRQLLTTASLSELADLLAEWKEPSAAPEDTDLTLSQTEADALAWGGNG